MGNNFIHPTKPTDFYEKKNNIDIELSKFIKNILKNNSFVTKDGTVKCLS